LRAIKKDKDELRKLGLICKEFSDRVPCDEVYVLVKNINRLLSHNEGAADELSELFQLLDNKCSVNLRGLTDSYV